MEDPRITRIKKDIENEINTSNSRYAFVGFGRSTQGATGAEEAAKKGVELVAGVEGVITAEKQLEELTKYITQYGTNDEIDKLVNTAKLNIYNANKALLGLQTAQKQRLKKLSEAILSASSANSLAGRYKNAFSRFKSRPSGKNFLRVKTLSPSKPKAYNLKPRKENTIPQRKIGSILAQKNRFGARPLTGLKSN